MSARLAMAVFESALPLRLKATAAVLALFANDAGDRIYPSVCRLSWLLGKAERHVRADVKELRDQGVLVALTRTRLHPTSGIQVPVGGRHATTHYRLDLSALPGRPVWQRKGRVGQRVELGNPDGSVTVSDETRVTASTEKGDHFDIERVTLATERVTLATQKSDASVTRSVRDPSVQDPRERSVRKESSTATAAPPPLSSPVQRVSPPPSGDDDAAPRPSTSAASSRALSRAPARDGNFKVIVKLAHTVIDQVGICDPRDGELIEALKQRCARERVDYGADPDVANDVVHRALHCACMQRVLNLPVNGSGSTIGGFASVGSFATALREADPAERGELLRDLGKRVSRGARSARPRGSR